eukprot:1161929-Pelagomonas_calceolata.AAC.2
MTTHQLIEELYSGCIVRYVRDVAFITPQTQQPARHKREERADKKKAGSVPQALKINLRQVEERDWKYKKREKLRYRKRHRSLISLSTTSKNLSSYASKELSDSHFLAA